MYIMNCNLSDIFYQLLEDFVNYLVQNDLVEIDTTNFLLEELVEVLVERMVEEDVDEEFTEVNVQKMMIAKCRKAHHLLILNLLNFRKSIGEVEKLYKYYLKWLATTQKFKGEID